MPRRTADRQVVLPGRTARLALCHPVAAGEARGYAADMADLLRPTFERPVEGIAPDAVAARISAGLSESGLPHRRAGGHFQIWLPDGQRRTWSPWLHLDVLAVPEDPARSVLFGRYTPAPSLWTGFMLTYLALATVAVGGALFGYSQWLVGEAPTGLWLVLFAAAVGLLLLASSRVGQRLAREEMLALGAAVERATSDEPGATAPRILVG